MLNIQKKKNFYRGSIGLVLLIFVGGFFFGGCEPLRKKFTRKNKEQKEHGIVPVLDPIEYPPMAENPRRQYRHFYSAWKMWHKELMVMLDEKSLNDKKIHYIFTQMDSTLQNMKALVVSEKQAVMEKHLQTLRDAARDMEKSYNLRNPYGLKRDLERLDRDIRHEFTISAVENYIIKTE